MCIIMAFSPPAQIWYLAHTQLTNCATFASTITQHTFLRPPATSYGLPQQITMPKCKLDQPIYMRMRKCHFSYQILVWVPGLTGSGMPWPSKWTTIFGHKGP